MLPLKLRSLISLFENKKLGMQILKPIKAIYEFIIWQSICWKSKRRLKKHFGNKLFHDPKLPNLRVTRISIPQIPNLFSFNPASFYDRKTGQLRSIYRVSSWGCNRVRSYRGHMPYEKTSGNFLGSHWDSTFVYNHLAEINHSKPYESRVWHKFSIESNLEDPKHFQDDDNNDWILCSKVTFTKSSVKRVFYHKICAIRITDAYKIEFQSPFNLTTEKNWVPISCNQRVLKVLYSNNPLMIINLNLKTGAIESMFKSKNDNFPTHGGSSFVPLSQDYFLRISRIKFPSPNMGFVYMSILSIHNREYEEILQSRPFIFEGLGVEICNSLILDESKGKAIFSWGREDKDVMIGEIEIKSLFSWLLDNCHLSKPENESDLLNLKMIIGKL